ncbi:hypothetical protein [Paraliomyxa miuraensis]|uniref:hypothetical protein n=1 Tax=Paraliomyxa miuraensis TaxID=376150 RepID=UPI0022548D44|nr:hypothetical protein [Paraliomyxa miuraensis]
MPSQGWQRTDQRACEPEAPAILCLSPESEGPYELKVADRVVLPGECVQAPSSAARGRLRVALHASGAEVATPSVRVGAGQRTEIEVTQQRRGPGVAVVERRRCDARVPTPGGSP